ncbi:DUF3014 domain-containing protein [Caldimonas sp. KR1-144]|uniref:DUF3014 domain-containing protein n=1 Tax=Caldimonas sp. KR1-144 TaxID=3400911 RepID=UPI003C001085
MNEQRLTWLLSALAALVVAAAGYLVWREYGRPKPPLSLPAEAPASAPLPVTEVPAEPASAVRYPLDLGEPAASAPGPGGEAGIRQAVEGLVGRSAALNFVQFDGLARRFVATVDNLPRERAPSNLWPVHPTAGRFSTTDANALRYKAFVDLVASLDAERTVALYKQFYPQFQRAYEDLGYPGRYFNDRLVDVIDHLLATPAPGQPPALSLPEVRGPNRPALPWVMYEFDDPALASRSAGQKALLRMGPANAQRVKAKLSEIRALLVRRAPAAG